MQQMYRQAAPPLQPFSVISPDIRASPSSQYVTYAGIQGQPQHPPYLPPIHPNPMHERQYHMPYDPAPRSRHQARASFPLQVKSESSTSVLYTQQSAGRTREKGIRIEREKEWKYKGGDERFAG